MKKPTKRQSRLDRLRANLYIVALFGDIPDYHRKRLFLMSKMPTKANAALIGSAKRLVPYIEQIAASKPKGRKPGPKTHDRLK
jgi:hypothetical protein